MSSEGGKTSPTTSVLVCTYDRPGMLARLLTSVSRSRERPDQLIVVNGGGDAANEIVRGEAARFDEVVLVQYVNRNLATSRNLGLRFVTGEILAFTDDDAVPDPDWLRHLKHAHLLQSAAGIGGPVSGLDERSFLSQVADLVTFPTFQGQREVRTLPGVNVSYKREAMARVGPFDESLFRGEDVDFNWRLIRLGYKLLYDPAVRVKHEHRASFRGLLWQQFMYGRAYVLVRHKWPDLYSVYPRSLRTPRDWLKLLHCFAAVLYQPALLCRRLKRTDGALAAYPLLVLHHLVWKTGMVFQAISNRGLVAGAGVEECPHVEIWRKGKLEVEESVSTREEAGR